MRLQRALIATIVVLVVVLVGQLAYQHFNPPTRYAMASWKDRPDSAEQTTELADHVVRVRVKNVRRAEPLTVAMENEPGGVDRVPVEVVTLEVLEDDAKGGKKTGETIELFHTGDSSQTPPGRRTDAPKGPQPEKPPDAVEKKDAAKHQSREGHMGVLFSAVMGDPEYKAGEEYLMFVREGPTLKVGGQSVATQAAISPEGRWKVDRSGRLEPMSDKPWAERMRGKPAKELRDQAAAAKGRGRGPGGSE